jgi:hypothetical protein
MILYKKQDEANFKNKRGCCKNEQPLFYNLNLTTCHVNSWMQEVA